MRTQSWRFSSSPMPSPGWRGSGQSLRCPNRWERSGSSSGASARSSRPSSSRGSGVIRSGRGHARSSTGASRPVVRRRVRYPAAAHHTHEYRPHRRGHVRRPGTASRARLARARLVRRYRARRWRERRTRLARTRTSEAPGTVRPRASDAHPRRGLGALAPPAAGDWQHRVPRAGVVRCSR